MVWNKHYLLRKLQGQINYKYTLELQQNLDKFNSQIFRGKIR